MSTFAETLSTVFRVNGVKLYQKERKTLCQNIGKQRIMCGQMYGNKRCKITETKRNRAKQHRYDGTCYLCVGWKIIRMPSLRPSLQSLSPLSPKSKISSPTYKIKWRSMTENNILARNKNKLHQGGHANARKYLCYTKV